MILHGEWREHKYIRKYKNNNGKTIYEYSKPQDVLGYDELKRAQDADREYQKAIRKNTNKRYSSRSEMERAFKQEQELGKKAQKAYDKYKKTPLGVIDSAGDMIYRGKAAVGRALEKIGKKLQDK